MPPPLPPWARVSSSCSSSTKDNTDSNNDDEEVSLHEEELYLRSRAHAALSQELDSVVESLVEEHVGKVGVKLQHFFDKCSISDDAVETSSTTANPFCVLPPTRYNPNLLPCALLQAPTHSSDQQLLVQCLVNALQKQTRTAVAHVIVETTTTTSCGPLVEQVWRQCAAQDQFFVKKRSRKRKRYTQTHHLLKWAETSTTFDQVVVILEPQSSKRILQDFVQLLAQLRRQHGLQVQLIQVGGSTMEDTQKGDLLLQSFSLPSSHQLVSSLWSTWIDKQASLLLLSPTILVALHASFQHYSQSFCQTVDLLKKSLALKLQHPESLIPMMHHESFLQDEGRRLAWFALAAREYLFGASRRNSNTSIEELHKRIRQSRMESHMMQSLLQVLTTTVLDEVDVMDILKTLQSPAIMRSMAARVVVVKDNTLLLKRLTAVRAIWMKSPPSRADAQVQFDEWIGYKHDDDDGAAPLQTMIDSVNELIILVEHKNANDDDDGCLNEYIQEWILGLFRQLNKLWTTAKDDDDDDIVETLFPQHRRDMATAIATGTVVKGSSTREVRVASCLWNLIPDLVAIPRYDWFHLALPQFFKSLPEEEAWWLFSLGIYQLLHVGLIRPKQRGTKEMVYEKAALVWSTT